MKQIYYYNQRFPEYGIKSFEVLDELYLVGKDIKCLNYLVADFDVEMECEAENRWISVYTPYKDEDDILVHDREFNNNLILCYDKEKITEWWQGEFNMQKERLEERLERFSVENEIQN